ncbi:MAG: tyrosine-type recombinase/integrase [Deltaproteobacteria bacterium]|nr:tyrosine-type recombinase/integrase [Deltaproteobacteria bacterium]
MLGDDVRDVQAAAQRLRPRVVGFDRDAFCSRLADLGHPPGTVRTKLSIADNLAQWLAEKNLAVADLDERRADEFIVERRRRGYRCAGFRTTILFLLDQLRSAGVASRLAPPRDESPAAVLLESYEHYLRRERGVVDNTIKAYLPFVRGFVAARLDGDVGRSGSLRAGDVREFLLGRVRGMACRSAQLMASALRSFLGFLFLRGRTETDLAAAVPTVRRWRQSSVPRYIPAADVERLLRACDRSSATGRRDHAILLLLARLGLRASEVVGLELGDLRWREGEVIVRGKGQVRDRLPLLPDVGRALARYIRKDRPPATCARVFLRRPAPHRGFAQHCTVSNIVAQAFRRAGLAPATRGAHVLRHSLATAMVRRGASLAEIGQVLRHRSADTTAIYAKLDFDALRDIALPWPTTGGGQ